VKRHSLRVQVELSCPCGGNAGALLGHPLKGLNKKYDGPEIFVSPLAFRCGACGKTLELLDTERHGYHGELGASAKLRGQGRRSSFRCPRCSGTDFQPAVALSYAGATLDLWEDSDEDDDDEVKVEDYFEGFELRGKCSRCGVESIISELDL
jgi:hypothetical protein